MDVAIVGAGYVGLVTGLCLADRGHRVTCVDVDESKVARLRAGVLPLYENGLDQLLERHLGRRFVPTTDLGAAVRGAELTLITVGTPFENGAINLRFVAEAAAAIGGVLATTSSYHVVVVKSTVVPGTTDDLVRPILEETSGKRNGEGLGVGMNPEFLREGEAVDDFQNPDRIVLGADDARCLDAMARLYADFDASLQIRTNARTAEMIKYASNALLATLISFSNEIGNLCSAAGTVDVVDVLGAVHLDRRITTRLSDGSRVTPGLAAYLKAGCGFGGSCFPKDVRALARWSEENNRAPRLLDAVLDTNDTQPLETIALVKKHLTSLAGTRVVVLGLAFKPGTDDIRESPALRVIPALIAEGAHVVAYDPVAISAARAVLGSTGVEYAGTLPEAVRGADAIILLTGWPQFQELPGLLDTCGPPPLVIDGRRVLDRRRVQRYDGIGLGTLLASPDLPGAVGVRA